MDCGEYLMGMDVDPTASSAANQIPDTFAHILARNVHVKCFELKQSFRFWGMSQRVLRFKLLDFIAGELLAFNLPCHLKLLRQGDLRRAQLHNGA